MTRLLLIVFVLATAFGRLPAQSPVWQPSPGHTQVPIWPGTPPDAPKDNAPENVVVTGSDSLVAGKPWTSIGNVTTPTITVYSPSGENTGAAVLVFPGSGYQILAIDLEGTEVCDWLTAKGITCVLLKYRVPDENGKYYPKSGPYPASSLALEDAQRAISLLRSHANDWRIDPHRIGVLGFSAGGHLVAAVSTHFAQRIYRPADAVDRVSCRPDFAVALYPGHLSLANNSIALNPDIRTHITKHTPPTFLLQNEDDHVDRVEDALSYYFGLKAMGVPVELHSYAQGGHAFGLRRTQMPATWWPDLVESWMKTIGILKR